MTAVDDLVQEFGDLVSFLAVTDLEGVLSLPFAEFERTIRQLPLRDLRAMLELEQQGEGGEGRENIKERLGQRIQEMAALPSLLELDWRRITRRQYDFSRGDPIMAMIAPLDLYRLQTLRELTIDSQEMAEGSRESLLMMLEIGINNRKELGRDDIPCLSVREKVFITQVKELCE